MESSLRSLLTSPAEWERDPDVRRVLTQVLHTGLRQCGALGLVGTLLYVGLGVGGLGYELQWDYAAFRAAPSGEQVVVIGGLVVASLSTIALVLAEMECDLRTGRLFGLAAILLTATVATFEGAMRDVFAGPYVIPMYLIVVAIVPFRPRQVLGIGGAVMGLVYVLGPSGPAWSGTLRLSSEMMAHLAFVAGSSLLITATGAALYRRHASFATTQAQLQKNRDRLRRVQSVAQVGGWDCDSETDAATGTELFYSLLDLPDGETLSMRTALRALPSPARVQLRAALEKCKADGTPFSLQLPLYADDEAYRWIQVQGEPHPDRPPCRLTGTVQDITDRKRREQAVQQERDRFQTLFHSLPTPVVQVDIVDEAPRVRTVNAAFASVFDVDTGAVVDTRLCDALGPETDGDPLTTSVDRAFDSGTARTEVRLSTAQGPRDFEVHVATREPTDGPPEGYAVFVDVTERNRQEETLREREQKTTALYTATEALLRADDAETVGQEIEALVGETLNYSLNSVYLSDDATLVPPREVHTNGSAPEDVRSAAETQERLTDIYRSGQTVVAEDLCAVDPPFDCTSLRTAALLPIAKHGLVSVGSSEVQGIDSFDLRLLEILAAQAAAVLDRVDREQRLEQSEQQFHGVFENAAKGILLLDADGTIVEANPALEEMMGASAAALEGESLSALTAPEEIVTDRLLVDQLVAGPRDSLETETRFVRANGEPFWGLLTVSRQDAEGAVQAIGMIENIDDRKRRKEELKRAKSEAEKMSRLKSSFLANMSHEIRTPLTSILGFAEAIAEGEGTAQADVPVQTFAHRIVKSGTRLLDTLNSVLDFSRLEAGSYDLFPEPMDLRQDVEETASLLQPQAEDEDVSLHLELPEEPLPVRADRKALRRILRNLLQNAVKYTDAPGDVWLRVRPEAEAAVLEVEDTGIGMDPDEVPELFRPFKQKSTGLQRTYEGSGLGLAVVQRLVEAMDGTLDVETEKGEGTCIAVRLPRRTH